MFCFVFLAKTEYSLGWKYKCLCLHSKDHEEKKSWKYSLVHHHYYCYDDDCVFNREQGKNDDDVKQQQRWWQKLNFNLKIKIIFWPFAFSVMSSGLVFECFWPNQKIKQTAAGNNVLLFSIWV